MKPDHCLACQGGDLYQAEAASSESIVLRPSQSFWIGPFRAVVPRFWVCLTCGFVAPYIGDGDIKTIQSWKEKDRKNRDARGTVGDR